MDSTTRSIIQTTNPTGNLRIFPQFVDSTMTSIIQTIQAKQPYLSQIKFINMPLLI